LAKRIHSEVKQEGLTWESGYKIKPLAYGMKFLEISCEIIDAKVSIDDVIEKITETWPEEVQSVDIQSFDKK
jgi:translation elongation factor EF-1beta